MTGPALFPATAIRQTATTLGVVVWLVLLSAITIAPGVPTVWSPLNMLVLVPGWLSQPLLGRAYIVASLATVPILFCIWCRPVLWGTPIVPKRSFVLLASCISLSVLSFATDGDYALRYHGRDYVTGTFIVSAGSWCLLISLAFAARRFPRPGLNVLFHVAMFSWLAWYAFPYLGELP